MEFNLFISLLLSWVCVSLSFGLMLFIASLGRDVRNDFVSHD